MTIGNNPKIPGGVSSAPKVDASQPELEPEKKLEEETRFERSGSGGGSLQLDRVVAPAMVQKQEKVQETYFEMVERLEEEIQLQVEQVKEVLLESVEKKGDVEFMYVLDVSDVENQVCVNCGRPECTNYAQKYRVKTPEINLLFDSIVTFMETAERLGIRYGVIAYDDEVAPIRPLGGAGEHDNERVLRRLYSFKERKAYPSRFDSKWLKKQWDTYTPDKAFQTTVVKAADKPAIGMAAQMFRSGEDRNAHILVGKANLPDSSLRAVDFAMKKNDIKIRGIAIGKNAAKIAPRMFVKTEQAKDLHAVREQMGQRMKNALEDE